MSVVSDLNLRLEETDLKKNKKSYPVEFDDVYLSFFAWSTVFSLSMLILHERPKDKEC